MSKSKNKKKKSPNKPKVVPVGSRYPVLVGVCSEGSFLLHGLHETACFIRDYGYADDVQIFTANDEFLLDISCGQINQCIDKEYQNALKQVLGNINK